MTDRAHNAKPHEVRAMLAGRMSQTRRVLKKQPDAGAHSPAPYGRGFKPGYIVFARDAAPMQPWPYAPGDRLWVRETWKPHSTFAHMKPSEMPQSNVFFAADERYAPSNTKWVPPIHMPRWASRLTLIVTDVRVQRLQDIGYKDAIAEGILRGDPLPEVPNSHGYIWHDGVTDPIDGWTRDPTAAFATLWTHINGPEAWAANPWVVAISFKTIRANIDSPEAKAA